MLISFLRRLVLGAVLLSSLGAGFSFAAENFIWVEGESAATKNVVVHNWYDGSVNRSQLSGNDFISNFGPNPGQADYQFTAPQAGSYNFWIRSNPVNSPLLDYQLNGGAWTPVDFTNKTDLVNLAKDNKPDLRFIAWIKVGSVNLLAGANTISFKFHSANNNHGSLDCFLFVQSSFTPHGTVKPGQKLGTDEPGWWSFEPGSETFGKDALLDLSYLNEKEAGESGFLQASGDSFKLGNGQPVRFWGVNAGAPNELSHDQVDFMAARFAKLGINIARLQDSVFEREGNDPTKINADHLDKLFYTINAFKKKGIYVALSNYFSLGFSIKASDGIPGTEDAIGKQAFGLLIFDQRMQEIYKSWLKQVLMTKSPYSGKTLAEETSIGLFEIQNEDNLFFWTFHPEKLGKGPLAEIETKYGAWLTTKYGSLDKALAEWPDVKMPDDSVADGKAGLIGPYEMSSDGFPKQSPTKQKRILAQIHFYADLQRGFYADMVKYIRSDLGAKFPISASNWTTVPGMGFIERYTYADADVIDKHGYFGGKHTGDASAWSVRAGQSYEDKTAMMTPDEVPFQYVRIPGHPHVISEIAWNKPNMYIAEAELLISTYASLQGLDGVFLFAAGSGDWANNGGGNWTYMMPGEIGQSPADALQYRRGDLKPGDTVLRQVTTVDDILSLKSSSLIEGKNVDFHMDMAAKASQADQIAGFDPLSFFVGRVERTWDAKATPVAVDLSKFIDRDKKIITSSTGEVVWNYGAGVLTVNSPKSQAATGFLAKAGPIKLGDVTIQLRNEYGTVHVISLDDQPLATSKKILIQAFTEEKMYGFKSTNGVINDIGRPPITVHDIDATVTISNGSSIQATTLDEQGYAADKLQPQIADGNATIMLPKHGLYTVLTR